MRLYHRNRTLQNCDRILRNGDADREVRGAGGQVGTCAESEPRAREVVSTDLGAATAQGDRELLVGTCLCGSTVERAVGGGDWG